MTPKKSKEDSKFISFFNLQEAFGRQGCPVCRLLDQDSFHYLDSLLYEQVNDVGIRGNLRQSLGFCNRHAWKASDVGNCALGLAIIYEDILLRMKERMLEFQGALPDRVPPLKKFFHRGKKPDHAGSRQACPACRHIQECEKGYLKILLEFLSETEFEKKFRDSDGICFPHLITSIEEYPAHDNLPHLISRQIEKFESLGKELNDFIRKQDYQYANEPRGTEVDSWKRALEMAVGKKAIPRGG